MSGAPESSICGDYVNFGIFFIWFSMALGPILMTFSGLGAGLKFHDFRLKIARWRSDLGFRNRGLRARAA